MQIMAAVDEGIGVMTGKVGRPKKPDGEGSHVRIDSSVASMARRVADYRGLKIREYLSEILRPVVLRDYKETNQLIDAEIEKKKK
jgi:hypothetical protein